jgi:hypothetical protein
MAVMRLEFINKRAVGPQYAEARSVGTMIQPAGDFPGGDAQVRELLIARA